MTTTTTTTPDFDLEARMVLRRCEQDRALYLANVLGFYGRERHDRLKSTMDRIEAARTANEEALRR